MTTMPSRTNRPHDPDADGRPAIAFAHYADGRRDQVDTLEQLAAAVSQAIANDVEDRFVRVVTAAGERLLTRDEQRQLLVAMTKIPRPDETDDHPAS